MGFERLTKFTAPHLYARPQDIVRGLGWPGERKAITPSYVGEIIQDGGYELRRIYLLEGV
jgi:hypothetical protein